MGIVSARLENSERATIKETYGRPSISTAQHRTLVHPDANHLRPIAR